jgi:hypothetical protein
MPKQGKNGTTASETARRRAEILHNRRVKEILDRNERNRTAFDRWSRQRYHLDMNNTHSLVQGVRGGLFVNNEEGYPRYAIRRPHGGVETDPEIIYRLQKGYRVYVPHGLPGGVRGNPPPNYARMDERGRGKRRS